MFSLEIVKTHLLLISSRILGQGTALVECTLETKPLERNADYAVSLKVEPVEVIYDSVSSSVSVIFCTVGAGAGGGGTQKSFIRGGSAPRSNPLPFYIPFFSEKAPLSYTFYWKKVPLSNTFRKTSCHFFHVARNK